MVLNGGEVRGALEYFDILSVVRFGACSTPKKQPLQGGVSYWHKIAANIFGR
jgi:hypothetical protein